MTPKVLSALAVGVGLTGFASAEVFYVDQGEDWRKGDRERFYSQDQGSRIMPLSWMRALKTPDGAQFLHDALARYGYLANPDGPEPDLPVGFTAANAAGEKYVGITCAACHTRQIEVSGVPYRIDGGPAIVDFQTFLSDLDVAVGAAIDDFDAFASAVLGSDADPGAVAALKESIETWRLRHHTLISRALPDPPWGPGRLDAISMIFNRLAGLDIGEPPTYIIADNIAPADAPTRYPFLWNAPRQDKTQWPGFADNGNDILGLARNLGQVYGVFGVFHPKRQSGLFGLDRDYISDNSANFDGLGEVEDLIWKIGPPQWPWKIDTALATEGGAVFNRAAEDGGCVTCHGIETGAFRSFKHRTWKTPVQDVGTDNRECDVLARTVDTGVMSGAQIPFVTDRIEPSDTALSVLKTAVVGAIIQNALSFRSDDPAALRAPGAMETPPEFEYLPGAFRAPQDSEPAALVAPGAGSGCAYESRVLQGIWATAPYLHNGSVPTLEALLLPASERPAQFKLGPSYDIDAVGLAVEQTMFDHTLETTDCADVGSGNSRCGHEYGVGLSDDDRRALLEYLKTL